MLWFCKTRHLLCWGCLLLCMKSSQPDWAHGIATFVLIRIIVLLYTSTLDLCTYSTYHTQQVQAFCIYQNTKSCMVRSYLYKQASPGAPSSLCRRSIRYRHITSWGSQGVGEKNRYFKCKEQTECIHTDLLAGYGLGFGYNKKFVWVIMCITTAFIRYCMFLLFVIWLLLFILLIYRLFCNFIFHRSRSGVRILWKNLNYLFFPTFRNTKMQTLCTQL